MRRAQSRCGERPACRPLAHVAACLVPTGLGGPGVVGRCQAEGLPLGIRCDPGVAVLQGVPGRAAGPAGVPSAERVCRSHARARVQAQAIYWRKRCRVPPLQPHTRVPMRAGGGWQPNGSKFTCAGGPTRRRGATCEGEGWCLWWGRSRGGGYGPRQADKVRRPVATG